MKANTKLGLAGRKILIGTTPFDGHVNPLTGLAVYLQDAGAEVRWYSSATYRKKIERLGIRYYEFVKAPKADSSNVMEMMEDREKITDPAEKANYDMRFFFARLAPGAYQDIKDIHDEFPFDIMIADSTFTPIPLVRSNLKVPVIAIGITPLAEESIDLGPYGPGFLPPTNEAQRQELLQLRELFLNVVFKTSIDEYSDILIANGIPHEPSIILDMVIKQADLYLQIGSPSFEYKRTDLGENVRFIGALLPYTSPFEGNQWFDERLLSFEKVVLVTQGTVEKDTKKLLEPTLEAFKNTDVLVIATTGGNRTAELRAMFPETNLIIEDFIPFNQVMPNADVYITNGGYGGVLQSITNELPMVTAGLHEGKAEICSRIGYFGYGINLKSEQPSPASIREGVSEIFKNSTYANNVKRLALEMGQYDSNELCARYVSALVQQRSKHLIRA